MGIALVTVPLSLRAVNGMMNVSGENRSYLPSLEFRRVRKGFRTADRASQRRGFRERESALYLFVTAVTWSLPLVFDDLLALWRERTSYWRPATAWPPAPRIAAEALAVAGFFTLILVLRSRLSFDFIYFQF